MKKINVFKFWDLPEGVTFSKQWGLYKFVLFRIGDMRPFKIVENKSFLKAVNIANKFIEQDNIERNGRRI